jgi:SAM-dependent methyltransferase
MKSTTVTPGLKQLINDRVKKYHCTTIEKNTRESLNYNANNNVYSIDAKSVNPNLLYSMELSARSILEAWPFINNCLLDIGCGNKPYKLLINSLVNSYIGIDLNKYNNNQTDIMANGLQLPFKSESFETVLSSDVIDEIQSPTLLFQEVNRILKPDGHFIVLVSNHYNIFENNTVYAHLTAEGLRNLTERNGFNIVMMRTKGKWIPFFLSLIIQLSYRLREKIARFWNPNFELKKESFRYFNSFMLVLQKFLLNITPASSIRTNVDWEKSRKEPSIRGSFHLGYLLVAKKVFNLNK